MNQDIDRSTIDEVGLSSSHEGVVVEASILGLEQQSNENLNFFSSCALAVETKRPHGKQVLLSNEAHRLLSWKFPKTPFLVCKYFHPLSLGNITVELLPSGESQGSSFLLIRKGDRSILYASRWSLENCAYLRSAALRKVDKVLFRFEKPFSHATLTTRHELERLDAVVAQHFANAKSVAFVADPIRDAPRLMPLLLQWRDRVFIDENIAPYLASLAETLPLGARIEPFPVWKQSARKIPREGTILALFTPQGYRKRESQLAGEFELVTTIANFNLTAPSETVSQAQAFQVAPQPNLADALRVMKETEANEAFILNNGPAAAQCAQSLRSHGIRVSLLSEPQTSTLF
jgi:hypothetical protein